MTLPELAALAAKVEGFVRPESGMCSGCGYEMGYCCCDAKGPEWDNSPAALLMAVALATTQLHLGNVAVTVRGPRIKGGDTMHGERTAEGLARAALVALLRAHGVEPTASTPETT